MSIEKTRRGRARARAASPTEGIASPRVARVGGAAASAIARWESGVEIDAGSGRDLFESHGLSGLVEALRRETARQGDARSGIVVASQRAREKASIAGIRRATARRGVQDRLRVEAEVGRLQLRGWRHRRKLKKAIGSARKSAEHIARKCERKLRKASSAVVAAELRAEALAAITEACSEAWREIEAEEAGPDCERLRLEIQGIHARGLEKVRSSSEPSALWAGVRDRSRGGPKPAPPPAPAEESR